MSRRPTCASLILAFVAATGVASIRRIVAFMAAPPLATPPTTTRNTVWRLVKAERLRRVGFGRYQAVEQ